MIKSDLKKVRNILDESVRYIVPNYQRNFEWKKEQAEEFWDDVSSGSVFLGNLVLDIHRESENEIIIVDGQQRITTIFVFLAACRYQARKINSHDQASVIQKKISFIDDTSGKAGVSKLIPSPSIAEVFIQTITNDEWNGKTFEGKKRQINKIKPIYEYFVGCISKLDKDELSEILKKLYESTFVKIDIEEPQEAFDIFERTNARGMELNAADLLKNYLFAKNASEEIEGDWDEIATNSAGTLLRMIKYFYVSQKGLIQKKLLFKALKKHGEIIGPSQLFKDIKEFSYYYSIIINSSVKNIIEWADETKNDFFLKEYNAKTLNRTLDALQLFGVTQAYPIMVKLMTVVSSIKNSEKKSKNSEKFLEFLQTLEKFHFINYAVSQQPGNQVENYYANKCEADINGNNVSDFIKTMISELKKEKVVGEFVFSEKFLEISYLNDFHLIYYIFDRFNNFSRKGGQYIELYNPDKKLLRRNFDIDHLISQNLDNYDFDAEKVGENIDNIGNLLVISKHTNGSVQNMAILDKLDVFKEKEVQNLSEAKKVVDDWGLKKWGSADDVIKNIMDRAKEMSDRAYNIVWKI